MRIKVYINDEKYKIINVLVTDNIKEITKKFRKWEYHL